MASMNLRQTLMLFMLNMHLLTVDTPTYGSRKVVVLSPNVFCGKNPLDFIAGFSFWQKKKKRKSHWLCLASMGESQRKFLCWSPLTEVYAESTSDRAMTTMFTTFTHSCHGVTQDSCDSCAVTIHKSRAE